MTGVPRWLQVASANAWRVLIVAAAIVALAYTVSQLRLVFLALVFAFFATALLRPVVEWLRRHSWPSIPAALVVLVGALAAFAALVAALVPTVAAQMGDLGAALEEGVEEGGRWLRDGPLGASDEDIRDAVDQVVDSVRNNAGEIADRVLTGAQVVLELVVAATLALVLTFFFLHDGDRIGSWLVDRFSPERRESVRRAGLNGWGALAGYLRGMAIVATFDAVFIGLALLILGVPAALPLAVFTFFGAFIPIVGAFVTGFAAVLVALVSEGLVIALLTLAAVIIVQQVESNVLHPVVMGRAVSLHPVAILLSVTAGGLVAGIFGAFVAVPIVAVTVRVLESLHADSGEEAPPEGEPRPDTS